MATADADADAGADTEVDAKADAVAVAAVVSDVGVGREDVEYDEGAIRGTLSFRSLCATQSTLALGCGPALALAFAATWYGAATAGLGVCKMTPATATTAAAEWLEERGSCCTTAGRVSCSAAGTSRRGVGVGAAFKASAARCSST